MERQICKSHLVSPDVVPSSPGLNQLRVLFQLQKIFMRRFSKVEKMTEAQKVKLTLDYIHAIDHELSEIRDWLPWKHWKKYGNFKVNAHELRFEIADIMCFLMNIAMVWGMEESEFFRYVYSKQSLNVLRQKDPKFGYFNKKQKKR